jgi:hypothetical protein
MVVQHENVVLPSSFVGSAVEKLGVRVARFHPSDPRSLEQSQLVNCR